MSETEVLSAEEQAAVAPPAPAAPQPAPSAPEPAPAAVVAPQPAPEPAKPAVEAPKAQEPAPEPAKPPPGFVPVAHFIELRRELADLKRQIAPKPQEPQVPDITQDPAANLDHRVKQAEQAIRSVQEVTTAQQTMQQVLGVYRADAARVAQADPEFNDAYAHWRSSVGNYFEAMTPGLDPGQREQALNNHEFQIVMGALQGGRSPAEAIREMSRKLGYAGKPKADPPPTPDPAAEIIRKAQAQAQATSPTAGLGASPPAELTPETILAMGDDELANLSRGKWRQAWLGSRT